MKLAPFDPEHTLLLDRADARPHFLTSAGGRAIVAGGCTRLRASAVPHRSCTLHGFARTA
jgi:hypothetical protein